MWVSSLLAVGSALAGRAYFLFDGKKKVAKEKTTPGSVAPSGLPCATRSVGRLAKLAAARLRQRQPTSPASPALLGTSQGARETRLRVGRAQDLSTNARVRAPFGVPMWSAEQRRRAGGLRRGLFEGRSPEFRSRPALRVAQGSRRSRPRSLGSPFLCLLSFGEAKESETPRKGGTHRQRSNNTNPQSGQIKT
jgi:hypothetical protein